MLQRRWIGLAVILLTLQFGCTENRGDSGATAKRDPVANASANTSGSGLATSGSNGAEATKPFVMVSVPANPAELLTLLQAEVAKAKALKLKPFVEFHAAWCGPCKQLEKSLDDPKMVEAFKGTYIIRLDADVWGPRLRGTGFNASAIPVFFQLDDEAKPTGRKIDGGAWEENIPENMAPPLQSFFRG